MISLMKNPFLRDKSIVGSVSALEEKKKKKKTTV